MTQPFIKTTLAALILISGLIVTTSLTQASGITTSSSATNPGQVRVVNDDGVMYLSNEVITNQDGQALTSTRYDNESWGTISLFGTALIPPTGYAKNIGSAISAVLNLILVIATLLVLVYLVWGAMSWITSGGDKTKIEAARQKIIAAIVGLIIVASSYAIIVLLVRFLGFTSLEDMLTDIPTIDQIGPVPSPSPTPLPSLSPSPIASLSGTATPTPTAATRSGLLNIFNF